MEKREKIFIVLITLIILVGIFIAFILSNSAKNPPEVLVQNNDKKISTAVMGGYEWKVFGTTHIADAQDLKEIEYDIKNTVVSKTGENLTISTTEKFTLENVEFISNMTNEIITTYSKINEGNNYLTVASPELEGTYICLFKLNYFDKGSAEYGIKVVVTDDNIYDVDAIKNFKNTKFEDIVTIKEIASKLPYAKKIAGIMLDNMQENKSLIIRYNNEQIEKEDLINNSIALFALIPELDNVIYEIESPTINETIYYSRIEINDIASRDVLEYAKNSELWIKEIIYKEKEPYNKDITIYISTIKTTLAKMNSKDLGDYIAIDVTKRKVSGDIENISGDEVILDEYDIKKLLTELNKEYELVLNVDSNNFNNKSGTLVNINVETSGDSEYIVKVDLKTANGKNIEETYNALKSGDSVMINTNEKKILNISGE